MTDTINTLIYHNPNIRYGFHIRKVKTLFGSFDAKVGGALSAYQIYLGNGHSLKPPVVSPADILQTRHLLERSGMYGCVHGSLLYNIAGAAKEPDVERLWPLTKKSLVTELDYAAGFNAGVVVHMGSCKKHD